MKVYLGSPGAPFLVSRSGMVIEAEGLTRKFAGVTALFGVGLGVEEGESVALLGPNGAGKSTLLRLCATSLRPTAGSLRLFGCDARSTARQVRRRIGFLSHQSFLYPELTAAENLLFYAEMFGVVERKQRIAELLQQVGLLGWVNRPVATLSKGLEQRCALARALLHAPQLLLLDEPFTGLDSDAASMLCRTLAAETARGTTILMATHDLDRAAQVCDRAVVLHRGRVAGVAPIVRDDADAMRCVYEAALGSSQEAGQ